MFVAQSCTNLDEELFSDLAADNFFKTDEEFVAALGAAYSSFGGIGNHGGLWTVNELASDELVITTKGGDWDDGGQLIQLLKHNIPIDHPMVNGSWGWLYGGVNTVNRLIFQFEQLGTPESEAFVAELRAVRALWYYWLLDAFGNVPLVTDFTDTSVPANNATFATGRTAVYTFVKSELDAIIPLLPTAVDGTTYGRMTKWAALAIRAKLQLNAEVYTGTPAWAGAASDASEIIASSKYNLQSYYADNFKVNNAGSSENIFVYPYDKVFAGGFNWPMMTLHYASQGVYDLTSQPWNGYSAIEEFYNSYIDPVNNPGPQGLVWKDLATDDNSDGIPDNGDMGTQDERLSNFVVGPQFNLDGSRAIDVGVEVSDPDGQKITFTPLINQSRPNGWRQGGARIGKYEYEIGGTRNMSNDFVIFRYADILLIRAEALWRQSAGSAEALTLVNQVRDRAGVDDFGSLTADNLLAERGREMFAEMNRRQDLIRYGKFGIVRWEKTVDADDHWEVFPIPKAQRDVNPGLKQNPGYP